MRECLVIVAEEDKLKGDVPDLLSEGGYDVKGVPIAPKAYTAVYEFMPEMVLYRWSSDSTALHKLFVDLRSIIDVPILVLASSSICTEEFTVEVLRLGADDCLCEPYGEKELLARVKAHMRRYWQWSEAEAQEEPVIDPVSRSVVLGEQKIKLTRNEYRLLRCLMEHSGGVVSREKLHNAVWGARADCISSTSLNLCIHKLRKKIERDPHRPEYILTKWGMGYYLGAKAEKA